MASGRHTVRRVALGLALALLAGACSERSDQPAVLDSAAVDSGVDVEIIGPAGDDASASQPAEEAPTGPAPVYSVVAQATVDAVAALAEPEDGAEAVARFSNPTPSGAPLVFRAVDGGLEHSPDWLEVQLPVQPNGTTGWIKRSEVSLSNNPYRIEVDRGRFSLTVFNLNDVWVEATIAVGDGATPTPVGEFYLMELLAPPDPGGPYGPFAFGLSGFSEVLTEFGGADSAIIGLHGTNDPASLGTTVSHGCIRLDNSIIEELAGTLPLGTPVVIT